MFATIYLPNFALQAAMRHEVLSSSIPVALIDEKEKKAVIIQFNRAAETAGVRTGMAPSQGLGRCLSLIIKARSAIKEESLANMILQYAFTLSPYVEATGAGVWTIQFTDNRDLSAKLLRVVQQLAECEIDAQAGIAPEPDSSFLAAHLARPVLQIDNPKEYLAPLSIDILAIPLPS
jgi:nucleotidyltransferase/DNA polymerase involved in DNA repair